MEAFLRPEARFGTSSVERLKRQNVESLERWSVALARTSDPEANSRAAKREKAALPAWASTSGRAQKVRVTRSKKTSSLEPRASNLEQNVEPLPGHLDFEL